MKENYKIYLPYQFCLRAQSVDWEPQISNKKMKTLFLSNMSKSRRLTSTFFPIKILSWIFLQPNLGVKQMAFESCPDVVEVTATSKEIKLGRPERGHLKDLSWSLKMVKDFVSVFHVDVKHWQKCFSQRPKRVDNLCFHIHLTRLYFHLCGNWTKLVEA